MPRARRVDARRRDRFAQRVLANAHELARKLGRAGGRLAEPKGNGRGSALRIRDADYARADAQDAPRRGAELEDVAAVRLDGEVFVERADERALGLEDDLVIGVVGDRTAGCDGRDARATGCPNLFANAVPVEQRPSSRRVNGDGGVEVLARELAVRPRAAKDLEKLVLEPGFRHARGDDLLR